MSERLYGGRPIEFFENNYTKFVDDGWAENIIRDMTDHIRELKTALEFYADINKWKNKNPSHASGYACDTLSDMGAIARKGAER